jgi:ATP-dependent DNA ligase
LSASRFIATADLGLGVKLEDMFVFPNKPIEFFNIPSMLSVFNLSEWLVQPKWDGHRALPACDSEGRVVVWNRQRKALTLAGTNWQWLSMLPLERPWLADGELTRSGRLILWDFAIWGGQCLYTTPYEQRLQTLGKALTKTYSKDKLQVELVETLPAESYKSLLLKRGAQDLEGLVFKNKGATNLWGPFATSDVASQCKFRFKK